MGVPLFKSLVAAALGSAGTDGEGMLFRVSREKKQDKHFSLLKCSSPSHNTVPTLYIDDLLHATAGYNLPSH